MKICIYILGMLVASVRCGSIFAASSFKSGIDFDHGFSHGFSPVSHADIKTVTTSYKSLGDFSSLGIHKDYGAVFGSGKPIVEVTDDQIDEVGHGSQVDFGKLKDVKFIKLGLTKGDSGSGSITGHSGFSDNDHVYTSGYAGPSEGHDIQTIKVIHVENGYDNYDGLSNRQLDFDSYVGHEGHHSSSNKLAGHQELSDGLHHFGTYNAPKGIKGTDGIEKFKIIKVIHAGDGSNVFKGYNDYKHFASGGGSFAKHAGFDGYAKTFSGHDSIGGPEAIKTIKVIHTAGSSRISDHSPKWL